MINEYYKLNKLLEDKKVLYIPIYSCFDYNTKLLNFKADGNINRFLTTFSNVNSYKSLDIFAPNKGNDVTWFYSAFYTVTHDSKIINSEYIVESAKVQRNIGFAKNILNEVNIEDYDIVIAEGQYVVLELLDFYKFIEVVYWCPVCATENKTRDFLEPNKALDKYIFSRVENTIVASDEQVKYIQSLRKGSQLRFSNIIFIETLIDRNLSIFDYNVDKKIIDNLVPMEEDGWKIIYLPFRLTDKGYKFNEILDILTYSNNQKVIVLYSNPNGCNIYSLTDDEVENEYIRKHFIKVSTDRNVYYTILDHLYCIIPYFEDTKFINHAAISEFTTSKTCTVVDNANALRIVLS